MQDRISKLLRMVDWSGRFAVSNGNGKAALAPAETKGLPTLDGSFDFSGPSPGRWTYFNSAVPGDVEAVSRETAYAAALYCYVAVRYRAENIAEPPLQVVEETDDGWEPVLDHALAELLEQPSPDYDMGEMIELTQTWLDIGAKALWVKDRNLVGGLGRLTPFGDREFQVEATRDRIYGRFVVDTAAGPRDYEPEDVVFFRLVNPSARRGGLSPTDVALAWLNLGTRTTATIKAILENAVFPSVVISTDKDWHPSPEEYERFRALLEQYHSGPAKAGKPFVNMGGGRVDRTTLTLNELVPDQLLDRIEACVASAFGIPPVVLSFLVGLKNSPWSQMEEARRYAYEDTIEPIWRKHAKRLTQQLLRPVDPNPRRRIAFDTSEVRALQIDESRRTNDAARARWWTLNERRVWTGQDPLPEGDPRGEWIEATDDRPAGSDAQAAAQDDEIARILAGTEAEDA